MKYSVLILFLLSSINITAQTIQGRVLDEKERAISYANVVLLTSDSVFIDGLVTNEAGEFLFHTSQINDGEYHIRISYIGTRVRDKK